MDHNIDKILIGQNAIKQKVAELAKKINEHYYSYDLILIAVLNGSLMFFADLVRLIYLPVKFDFIGISSYEGTSSSELINMTKELKLKPEGSHILLVDDIMDTGQTLFKIKQMLLKMGAKDVKTCVLLDKPLVRRKIPITADFCGFEIADEFVVGYGLDYKEKYRNLPYIATIKKEQS